MSCNLHPDTSHIDCDGCALNARAAYDPNCSFCCGDGWLDPFPAVSFDEHDPTEQSIAIPCQCWKDEWEEPDHPDADEDGWLDGIPITEAKFYGRKLRPDEVDTVVMHCGASSKATWGSYFQRPLAKNKETGELYWRRVSTHFGVDDAGRISAYVPYQNAAWHSGCINFSSLGWEHQGPAERKDWTAEMTEASVHLARTMMSIYPNITRAVSHRYLCPRRRRDPGPHFPYEAFEALGLEVIR